MPESTIGRIIRRRIKRRVSYRLARIIHPIIIAYVDIYHGDEEVEVDSGEAEDKQRMDLTGTVTGHFEVSANLDHQVTEVIGRRFGFGPPDRRA